MSNLNISKSPLAKSYIEDPNTNIVTSKIYEILDNKVPNKKNKVLILGLTIPSMDYYNPNLMEQTEFYNNSNKNDAALQERNLRKTLKEIKNQVAEFKRLNPKGSVIVLSHMGNRISKMIAKVAPQINLILNGHDHKEFEILVGNTLILSHGQSSAFFRGSQFVIEDDSSVSIQSKRFDTEKYEQIARKDQKLQEFVSVNIKKDLDPLVTFVHPEATPEELVLDDSIRYSNNLLANYFTTSMKSMALKYYPDLDLLALPSTIVRSGLKSNEKRTTLNNMDFMKIFDGVNENQTELKIGSVKGSLLYEMILENVLNNLKSRTRNALVQWSDIQINRTLVKSLKEDLSNPELKEAIKIRNKETGLFEKIDFDKEYKILISDKYLLKETENIKVPAKIKDNFKLTRLTYDILFKKYLESINFDVVIPAIAREKRVM